MMLLNKYAGVSILDSCAVHSALRVIDNKNALQWQQQNKNFCLQACGSGRDYRLLCGNCDRFRPKYE